LKQAFQQYEKKQEERYSEQVWKQKHLSREAEERILIALRKRSRRLMWKRAFVRVGEGLAVAAVFCMMAYAVYLAAQGPKDPIVAGTGETETQTVATETKTETSPTDEVPPGYRAAVQRELDYQSKKLDEVLQTKKQRSMEEFQNFISKQIPVSAANESKMEVWRAQEVEHARANDRLPTVLYGPFVREKFFPLLAEAYVTNEYEWVVWAEEMLLKFKSYAFHRKHLSEMECTVWNPETQREEHYTFEELYAAVAERSATLKEEKRKAEDHQYRLQLFLHDL
jgi:hypothetical protein